MNKNTIPAESFLEAASVFHWATNRHFQLWFTGQFKTRHKRVETVLKRLSKRGKIRSVRYGKCLIYSLPRKTKGFSEIAPKVAHGLACTECLVRFYRSNTQGVVVPERFFFGLGSVPEWGIIYPNGKMLLFEFCTKSNFFFSGLMAAKLSAYEKNIAKIEEKFNVKAIVVFVLDVPREVVERFVNREREAGTVADGDLSAPPEGGLPLTPVFFTDYETFKAVPVGSQLNTPIYIWSVDGKQYKLSENV